MAPTTDNNWKCLHTAMISAVGSEAELHQLLRLECGWNPRRIFSSPGKLSDQVYDTIDWCARQGNTAELVAALQNLYPRNPDVLEYVACQQAQHHQPPRSGSPESEPVTSAEVPKWYVPVYGLTVGISCLHDVEHCLGEATRWQLIKGFPVATYAGHGLKITFDGDTRNNPCIQLMRLRVAQARQLPLGLEPGLPRARLESLLAPIFGPSLEPRGAPTVSYAPPPSVPGNRLIFELDNGCIVSVAILAVNHR